jgi:TolA-binding protein
VISRLRLLPFALLALVGCGAAHDAALDKELSSLRSELIKVRADQAALSERLDAVQLGRSGPIGAPPAASGSASDSPDLDVVRLTPESGAADDDGPPVAIRSVGSGLVTDKKNGSATSDDFDRGLELYKSKKYDKALEAFAAYLVKSPDGGNADLATYYRGECLYQKSDFKKAAEQFEAVRGGTKVADALLRLAQCKTKLGDKAGADEIKKKLLANYPSSDAARKLSTPSGKKP